jgi:hypothetical protein
MESSRSRNSLVTALPVEGLFFPQREKLGFDARQLTPLLVSRVIVAAAQTRAFAKAAIVMADVAGQAVSAKTIERVAHDVGQELATRRDAVPKSHQALAQTPAAPPDLAVVECDGGRIRTREPDQGPGVHLSGKGWNETKNACLIRAERQTFAEDPQPEPPECFCDLQHVAKIAETQALSVAGPASTETTIDEDDNTMEPLPVSADWRPKRLVRTVLSSMANSDEFGRQMAREAQGRHFDQARAKAFLGDGLPWNWSIWKQHFSDFTPILDFIHALSYLFLVAKAIQSSENEAWDQYLVWMQGCWRGEIDQVLEELEVWQARLGSPPPDASDTDPREVLRKTCQYLNHNRSRMNYPEYRQHGMPVTTAWMESLVKEVNWRVKGTEMFWNNPEGAEAILQIRAAALCDDDRLKQHLRTRAGSPFTRRPKPATLSVE